VPDGRIRRRRPEADIDQALNRTDGPENFDAKESTMALDTLIDEIKAS